METATILEKTRRCGDVNAQTTVQIFSFAEGFLVELQTKNLRFCDGALLGTDCASWHLWDEAEYQELLASLEGNGFQVTAGRPLIQQLVQAFFGWLQ